ncbi:MAG: hypothetical protein CUN55_00950 [Phototrophicales bacterium]|nr:MAG: hypothetical protein CUN55_00950 [Phototrophicales bacterium]
MKKLLASFGIVGVGYWLWRFLSPRHSIMVLENKVVIITGASSGLGEAFAEVFARRGAKVVLAARREDRLRRVAERIAPYATDVLVMPVDITIPEQRQRLIDETLRTFGQIDILVNNAGVSGGNYYDQLDSSFIEQTLQVNLVAPLLLTRLVLPHMRQRNEGYIVNIGSAMGREPTPYFAHYCASKAGLAAFSDSLRRELFDTNIHVLYAALGWIRTEMLSPNAEDVLRQFPQHTVLSAQSVAEIVIESLVQGRYEVYSGNWIEHGGIRLERFAPRIVDWYWRFVTRYMPWLELSRKVS